jgi:general secretion pathway protein D
MKQTIRLMALCLTLVLALPLLAESSKSLFNKGSDAEARQDYVAAYNFYKQAYNQTPKDLKYRAAFERMKFQASAALVHRGQMLRDMGKLEDALALFEQAAAIDQASFIAVQEIQRTKEMIKIAQGGPSTMALPPRVSPLRKRVEEASGPIELEPVSNVPITLKLTEDTTVIYQTIGKLAGINVLFDPDYTPRRIHVELNGVTLTEALELVAMESKTFWRPVTPNTIFVAADTPAKRKEIEANAIKTFYLSNLSQPTELQDVVNTLRTVLEVQRITMIPSQAAIVIRGTPDQLALADMLIADLDKARPEVVIDVAIMQVQREKIRDLGISPPTSATVALQSNVTSTTTTTSTTGSTTPTTTTGQNQINLNSLGNLSAKDFVVTIPPATVTALFSDSNTKLLQNPQIRALDGQKASLKIGQRVPVATGSYGAGLTAGIGVNALVNTQFQYLDVGVNIDVTPKVHQNRDISLKLVLDVSAVTGQSNIGGINQPIIGQNKIEHDIRLKDGEINLLGGLLEDVDTKNISGFPGLSQIPILKYLFGSEHIDKRQNELVMVIVPHIVRAQELTSFNQRAVDIGTGNVIDLRTMAAKAAPVPAPGAAPATPAGPQQQPGTTPPQAPSTPQAPTAPSAPQTGPVTFNLDIPPQQTTVGSEFVVNVVLNGGQNIYSVPMQISYDPKMLELSDVTNGSFLSQDGQPVALVHRDDPSTGTLQVTATRPPNAGGVAGSGTVFSLLFKAKAAGTATLSITRAQVKDAFMNSVPSTGGQATVTIK